MSNFEIVLICLASAIPIVTFLFVFVKFKKKEKKEPAQTKTYEEIKKEEQNNSSEQVVEEKKVEEKKFIPDANNDFTPDDFKAYLNHKQKNISKPSRVDLPKDFVDTTLPYSPRRRRKVEEKPKTVAEEIRSLSPELKALIIAGVLDKKNFDCD